MLSVALALLACTEASQVKEFGFQVGLDPAMPLRATASWDIDAAPDAWVRFGEGRVSPRSTSGSVLLLGMPPDEDIVAELVSEDGVLAEATLHTGDLPGWVPELETTGNFGAGYISAVSFPLGGDPPSLVVIDGQGRVCGYRRFEELSRDISGHPLAWALQQEPGAAWVLLSDTDSQRAVRIGFDGADDVVIELPGAHHDLLRLEDGALAYTRSDERVVDDRFVTGDQLVVRAPDGTERVVWDAFATLPITRHDGWDQFFAIRGDWTHANGIAWDPDAGRWAVSLYWLHQLVVIDDTDGSVVSVLDGATTPEPFGPQHAPNWTGAGWWMFDNNQPGRGSRALLLGPDGSRLDEWRPPDGGFAPALGDVTPVADGRLLVSGGTLPDTWLVTPGEDDLVRIRWPLATSVGQQQWTESLYAAPLAE